MARFPDPLIPDGTGNRKNTTVSCQRAHDWVDLTPQEERLSCDPADFFHLVIRKALFRALFEARRYARVLENVGEGQHRAGLMENWTDPLSVLVDRAQVSWVAFGKGELSPDAMGRILAEMDRDPMWPQDTGPAAARRWAERVLPTDGLDDAFDA